MKKNKRIVFSIIALALVAVSLTLFDSNGDVPLYRTDKVTRGSIAEIVTANGTLNPVQIVTVGTQVSGQINKIYVSLNDQVKAGQLLAEIDPSLPEAALRQSKANLETARTAFEQAGRDLERTRMLVAKDYVAKVDLERAQQTYLSARNSHDSAKSQVERDEVNLGYTKITSPIDGVVISQEVTAGQTMAANFQTPNLFKIAGDLTQMKIDVSLSEADIAKVKAGMPAIFTVDAYPDREFEGTVQTVNLNPNNQSGVVTYIITVAVNNPDQALLPGMTAYVRVTLSEVKDVLRIPAAALRFAPPQEQASGLQRLLQGGMRSRRSRDKGVEESGSRKATIYLLQSGKAVPVEIRVGATDETLLEVSGDGIAEGDTVITGLMPASGR